MNRKKSASVILSFVLVFSLLQGRALAEAQVGKPAPDFSLPDTKGKTYSLKDFAGKHVVLEWTNYDCPFVAKHYASGNMQNLQKANTANGIVWLSINSSAAGKQGNYPAETWNKLIEEKGARPTAVLLDTNGKVGRRYGAQTTPHMYVINPEGTLVYAGAIDSIPSADTADIDQAANYVQAALDESLAGQAVATPSTKSYGCSVKY